MLKNKGIIPNAVKNGSKRDLISNDPYKNSEDNSQQTNKQGKGNGEFHYSGSFGVPQKFINTYSNDEKVMQTSQSMIH